MDLEGFHQKIQSSVATQAAELEDTPGSPYPYEESIFTEIMMNHLAEIGMTFNPMVCHYAARVGNANVRLSGCAISDEGDRLDLFISIYDGSPEIVSITDSETLTAVQHCMRFLEKCAVRKQSSAMEKSHDAYPIVVLIEEQFPNVDQLRLFVLTDRRSKSKSFKQREVNGKTVHLEVMDIERLFRHLAEGKPRDELYISFPEVCGSPLPCVYIPNQQSQYHYALTVFPGEALRFIYEKYGARLLEANVRAFLSATTKVNKGIRDTLKSEPEKFMAYNNGIVVIADEADFEKTADGAIGISWLKGMQIVNGGQTTASIYFTKKKNPEVDLSAVRVPAKVIILNHSATEEVEERLISDISKYANSQTAVKMSDLSANSVFHVEIEKLAETTYCPDGVGRWFYERAAGSYNVMLARLGDTQARLKKLKDERPSSRKITKTELAKYVNVWAEKPEHVSQGTQKNYLKFMEDVTSGELPPIKDVVEYKRTVGKAILFKRTQAIVRSLKFPAFQANITVYLVALLANRTAGNLDFEQVWQRQDITPQLERQLREWAPQVNARLEESACGRMISEWAKKPECWEAIKSSNYSPISSGIPELSS